mgnify:FL=1
MTMNPTSIPETYTLKRQEHINEIDSDVLLLEHALLGCPVVAIKNQDSNKTFAVAFHTIPTDSTGVAHILEHSVLMGSQKYPVKDVFGEINKGGLMTFLNAMTGSDVTYYPFATRNLKEYYNIMDVYCDVTLNPLLSRATFEQEGWHYHQESADAPLQFQGVVYNEMKGAFSNPTRLLFHHIFAALMPGSTYAHESGGDPERIPDLNHEAFCAFHAQHYHPSNAVFFLYGNAPLADELNLLHDKFLSRFPEARQRALTEPGEETHQIQYIKDCYGVDSSDLKEKTFLAVGSRVSTVDRREENAAFQVIANILFNSDASPLKNTIISSGLCKDFGGLYLSTSSAKTFMITYLVGSEPEHRDQFLALYQKALTSMIEEGLDRELLLSELNKFEFALREEASRAQRGLDLIGRLMPAFKYDTDPFESLNLEPLFRSIRHKALEENFFETLIRDYLLNNQATVVVTLSPDPDKGAKTRATEEQRLQAHAAALDNNGRQALIHRTQEMMAAQQAPNSSKTLALLPRLTLADLERRISVHTVTPTSIFGVEVLVNDLPTEQISYVDMGFDLSGVPARLLPYVNLFATIITEVGTRGKDYRRFARELGICTGDFSHDLNNYTQARNPKSTRPILWFHMKCLPEYQEQALQLMAEVFSSPALDDRTRIREIVLRECAWSEHNAQSEGYNLATALAFAHLSQSGIHNELTAGVTNYRKELQLARDYAAQEEEFLAALQEMAALIFNRANLVLGITADQKQVSRFANHGNCLVEALGQHPLFPQTVTIEGLARHEALISSAEVVFAVLAGNVFPEGQGYRGQFEVLKTYLSRDFLWNTVRQMGGAYGCFIQFSHISGNLAFVSYRDPQVRKTYDSYQSVPAAVARLDLDPQVLEQLIIGTYGNFTPHQGPSGRGATARNEYLSGITATDKQQQIDEIISTTSADLRSFAPALSQMIEQGHRTIIGNRSRIEDDGKLFDRISDL